jgi:hypothetical protein
MENDLVYRLRKRAEIRRSIPHRRSVINNEPDRIAALLDEAAAAIEELTKDVRSRTAGGGDQCGVYPDFN